MPASYRHINGYGNHTLSFINAEGERHWCKFHFKTRQGVQCITGEESANLIGIDRESHQRDLFEAIDQGEFPSWTVKVQIMTEEQAKTLRCNPFSQAIAGALGGARQDIQRRQLCHFFRADIDDGRRVAQALKIELDPATLQQNQQNNPQPVTA